MEGVVYFNLFTTKQSEFHISVTSGHIAPLELATKIAYWQDKDAQTIHEVI